MGISSGNDKSGTEMPCPPAPQWPAFYNSLLIAHSAMNSSINEPNNDVNTSVIHPSVNWDIILGTRLQHIEPSGKYINHFLCCYGQIADEKLWKEEGSIWVCDLKMVLVAGNWVTSQIIFMSGSKNHRGNRARLELQGPSPVDHAPQWSSAN